MSSKEDFLRNRTFKDQGLPLSQRVFYTLHQDSQTHDLQAHRTTKLLALLIEHLHTRKLLSEDEIDNLLVESIEVTSAS